jgi:hypothetical protein
MHIDRQILALFDRGILNRYSVPWPGEGDINRPTANVLDAIRTACVIAC